MRKALIFSVMALSLIAVFAVISLRGPKTTITLSDARAELHSTEAGVLHVFVGIGNGDQPDRLIGASSEVADSAILTTRPPASQVPVPANSSPVLSADGAFVTLRGVKTDLKEGQLIPISFEFETSGSLATRATISAPTDPHAAHRKMMAAGTMNMALLEPGSAPPTARLKVEHLSDDIWKLVLDVTNFTFDPELPEPVHVPGHGHAHLYLNGMKLQRMYGPQATIGALPSGTYTVSVSLNTNDHRPYIDGNGPVEALAEIVVQ